MADLTGAQAELPVGLTGLNTSGVPTTPVGSDTNGNLLVKDYSDGPVSPGTAAQTSILVGGQYNSTLPTLSNTQQAAVQVDSSGRVIANLASNSASGTFTAAAQTVSVSTLGCSTVQFGTLGTFVGQLVTEISYDNGTSWHSQATVDSSPNTNLSMLNWGDASANLFNNHPWIVPVAGTTNFRIRVVNYTSGSLSVVVNATSAVSSNLNPTNDRWAATTLSALSAAATGPTAGCSTCAINVTGTWVGTLTFQATIDHTNFFAVPAYNVGSNINVANTTSNGTFVISCGGFHQVQAIFTSYTSGSAVVTLESSPGSNNSIIDSVALQDAQTANMGNITHRNELRTASSTQIIGAVFNGTVLDTNAWSTTLTGSGTSTQSGGIEQLSTGTTANSSAFLSSVTRARFIARTINAYSGNIRVGDTGVANNIRRWGAYDSQDGVFFQLNGTTFGVGTRSAGVDTIVTSANFNGPKAVTIDTNFHSYEIQYGGTTVYFYQDNNLLHKFVITTAPATSTPHLLIGMETTNSGGGTSNASIYVIGAAILRYGESEARARYFHPFYTAKVQAVTASTTGAATSLVVPITATKAGNMIVVVTSALANTATVTDSASQSYSTATTVTSGSTRFYTFYFPNTAAGVTSVTITPAASDRVVAIVMEYSSILTASPLDKTSTNSQAAVTSWTSNATAATTQAVELLIGSALDAAHNNNVFTQGTGWTALGTIDGVGGGNTLTAFAEEQYVTATGTYAATGTNGTSATVLSAISTFKMQTTSLSTGLTIVNNPTTITIGAGTLRKVVINTIGTGSANVTFYDNTTNSGAIIATLALTSAIGSVDYDLDFSNGLTMVVNSATADFTVIYD